MNFCLLTEEGPLTNNVCSKLGLGTAQFGQDYGISNKKGQCSICEVSSIIKMAEQKNVRVIDTAHLYGTSEVALGKTLPKNHRFDIVTKTTNFEGNDITLSEINFLEKKFFQSLKRLNQKSIYGILIHNANDVLKDGGSLLIEKIKDFKNQGLVEKIGVSVYTTEQIIQIIPNYSIDIIQLPISIFDQRLLKNNILKKIKSLGIEIHARSVFLQGLLLAEPGELSPHFSSILRHLKKYHLFLRKHRISPVQAALDFVSNIREVDVVLCGVSSMLELEEIISFFQQETNINFSSFAINDPKILNPSNWKV